MLPWVSSGTPPGPIATIGRIPSAQSHMDFTPHQLTPQQQHARSCFDLDAALASLPPQPTPTTKGNAGTRLRDYLVSDIPDELLREFAQEQLGAQRCSSKYLHALRVVFGNQAHAERVGYVLEQNLRALDVPERVMRNIIDQMRKAKITQGVRVSLGDGRTQVVQCYDPRDSSLSFPDVDLETWLRAEEMAADRHMQNKVWDEVSPLLPSDEIPY